MNKLTNIVRQYLYEELSKIYNNIKIGSDHQDLSYVNFINAIRINLTTKNSPIHIIINHISGNIVVILYTRRINRSLVVSRIIVDIEAPNFGSLLNTVKSDIKTSCSCYQWELELCR